MFFYYFCNLSFFFEVSCNLLSFVFLNEFLYIKMHFLTFFHDVKKDPSLLQWIWNLSFGGGMWESNPPGTLLTPHTSFED